MPIRKQDTAPLLFELRDQVAWLTFNRPAALNSVNPAMLVELHHALDRILADEDARCVVLTGAGDAFCSGSDLGVVGALAGPGHEEQVDAFIADVNGLLNRIEQLPLPVIAAVNGTAVGAGLEFALCTDLIVARADARIGDGHARYGLLPGGGASVRLPRRIGTAAAKWLSFTGDLLPAEQLAACGLVQRVYPAAVFAAEVERLASRIASRSPLGLRRVKALIDNAMRVTVEQALAEEQRQLKLHRSSWDRAEGLTAFAEKRTPRFRGM